LFAEHAGRVFDRITLSLNQSFCKGGLLCKDFQFEATLLGCICLSEVRLLVRLDGVDDLLGLRIPSHLVKLDNMAKKVLEKAVSADNAVRKVGEAGNFPDSLCEGFTGVRLVVHHEGEPQAQFTKPDGLLLDVHTIKAGFDDLFLQIIVVVAACKHPLTMHKKV